MSTKSLREEITNISEKYAAIYNPNLQVVEEKAKNKSTDPKADVDGDGKAGTKTDKYLADLHARVQKYTQQAKSAEEEEQKGRVDLTTATAHKILLDLHKGGFKTPEIETILNTALQNHSAAKDSTVAAESIVSEVAGEANPAAMSTNAGEEEEINGQLLLPKISSIRDAIKAAFEIHQYVHEHIKDDELAEMIVMEIVNTMQALHQQHKATPAGDAMKTDLAV